MEDNQKYLESILSELTISLEENKFKEMEEKYNNLISEFESLWYSSERRNKKELKEYKNSLLELSNRNNRFINDSKEVGSIIQSKIVEICNELDILTNKDDFNRELPEYNELCNRYSQLKYFSDKLSSYIVKIDMCNYDTSSCIDDEDIFKYIDKTKKVDEDKIKEAFKECENVLYNIVENDRDIMNVNNLLLNMNYDIIPYLIEKKREYQTYTNYAIESMRNYLDENGLSHEDALENDSDYKHLNDYFNSMKKQFDDIDKDIITGVQLCLAIEENIRTGKSDWSITSTYNDDGKIVITKTKESGINKDSNERTKHKFNLKFFENAREIKDEIVIGQSDGNIYSRKFSFMFRGFGFKREDIFNLVKFKIKFKNIIEGSLGNLDVAFGYNKKIKDNEDSLSFKASANLGQIKESFLAEKDDKSYKLLSAELALLKGEISSNFSSTGIFSASKSFNFLAATGSIGLNDMSFMKINGYVGQDIDNLSTLWMMDQFEKGEKVGVKHIENDFGGNITFGNNLTIHKISTDGKDITSKSLDTNHLTSRDIYNGAKDVEQVDKLIRGNIGESTFPKKVLINKLSDDRYIEENNKDSKNPEIQREKQKQGYDYLDF